MNAAADFPRKRLYRFLTVGVGAALLLLFLCWLLVSLGLRPFAGSVLAYALAFAFAYSAQHRWTFGGEHEHSHSLPRYLALQAGCAIFSGIVSHVSVADFGLSPLPMSVFATAAASAASYILSSFWVFPAR